MASAQPQAIKRLALLLVLLLVALPLGGCWDIIELNDRGIVSIVGIDRTPEGQITVWAQVLQPTQLGGGGQGAPEIKSIVLDGRGATIEEAFIHLQDNFTPRLYLGHLHWVVVSERFARGGVLEMVDWLNRSLDRRLSIILLVTRGSVAEYLKLTSAFALRSIAVVRDAIANEIGGSSSLLAWSSDLMAAGRDPIMGSFQAVYSNGKLNTDIATYGGTALFRSDGRLVKFLDPADSVPFLLLNGDLLGGSTAQSYQGSGKIKRAVITSARTMMIENKGGYWAPLVLCCGSLVVLTFSLGYSGDSE